MAQTPKLPKLVASTGDVYCSSIAESKIRERKVLNNPSPTLEQPIEQVAEEDLEANYFRSAQW